MKEYFWYAFGVYYFGFLLVDNWKHIRKYLPTVGSQDRHP